MNSICEAYDSFRRMGLYQAVYFRKITAHAYTQEAKSGKPKDGAKLFSLYNQHQNL